MLGYQDEQLSLQSEQWQDCIVLKRVYHSVWYLIWEEVIQLIDSVDMLQNDAPRLQQYCKTLLTVCDDWWMRKTDNGSTHKGREFKVVQWI